MGNRYIECRDPPNGNSLKPVRTIVMAKVSAVAAAIGHRDVRQRAMIPRMDKTINRVATGGK